MSRERRDLFQPAYGRRLLADRRTGDETGYTGYTGYTSVERRSGIDRRTISGRRR